MHSSATDSSIFSVDSHNDCDVAWPAGIGGVGVGVDVLGKGSAPNTCSLAPETHYATPPEPVYFSPHTDFLQFT